MTAPNDWQIKKCLMLSGSLLLAVWGLIGLGALGLDILVLRQVVAFIFLSFVPGLLLLRILRIHNVHIIESLLYSVGLSLAFVMAVGVLANFALPPMGISRPIALLPLIVIMTVFLLILGVLAYIRDKDFRPSSRRDGQTSESIWQNFRANPAPYLLAVLLPLMAILGTTLVDVYHSSILIYALLLTIAIIIGLVAFNKFIPPRVYPLMVFMMALALLYQTTLISDYLVGSDIHQERYWAWVVLENGFWNATAPFAVNSCLSIVMLAPIYSLLLNMDVVWLLKVIYPLLFALMPLALFRIFRLQIKPQYAFLAVVFFITMPMFTMDMAQLVRQQVSELFFVLVILLMVDRRLNVIQRTALVIIFSGGVVVSYYGMGTGYIIGYLTFGVILLVFIKSRLGRTLWQWLIGKSNSLPPDLATPGAFNKRALALIVCAGLAFMLGYYGIVASGVSLKGTEIAARIVQTTGKQVARGITMPPSELPPPELPPSELPPSELPPSELPPPELPPSELPPSELPPSELPPSELPPPAIELTGFVQSLITRFPMLNPLRREPLVQTALGLDFAIASLGGKIWRIFQYLVELCLVIGFIRLIFRPSTLGNFRAEYLSLTIVSIIILLGIFSLPARSWGFNVTRLWQIILLIMSPLFIFGGETIARGIAKLAGVFRKIFKFSRSSYVSPALLWFPVFLIMIPYFIFNSGVVFELSKSQITSFIDVPYSVALSSHRLDINTVFTKQDVADATWLSEMAADGYPIYSDLHSKLAFPDTWGDEEAFATAIERRARMPGLPSGFQDMSFPCYIYFRAWNIGNRMLTFGTGYATRLSSYLDNLPWFVELIDESDMIYNNGSAEVLFYCGNGK
ncbi:MAG: DUF2206 domain-containing protein [Dehalococcoidia bacterium]|nr:DUF2206 domain-containing protein [Dehalococcoidia bacterium]